jgi:hypothetical protein
MEPPALGRQRERYPPENTPWRREGHPPSHSGAQLPKRRLLTVAGVAWSRRAARTRVLALNVIVVDVRIRTTTFSQALSAWDPDRPSTQEAERCFPHPHARKRCASLQCRSGAGGAPSAPVSYRPDIGRLTGSGLATDLAVGKPTARLDRTLAI